MRRIGIPLLLIGIAVHGKAQENYEIQVYGSQTVLKGNTMVELHSNYTFDGSKGVADGVLPTNHVFHETVEITHGWNSWFETGFYFFNTIGNEMRTTYVGNGALYISPSIPLLTSLFTGPIRTWGMSSPLT